MQHLTPEVDRRFAVALGDLERLFAASEREKLLDEKADKEVRTWLDGQEEPLPWAGAGVTADEWFFITTLYGEMTLAGQRTHIRTFFPCFVKRAGREIRNLSPELIADWHLRSGWMNGRLCRMAIILRERGATMEQYSDGLRQLEREATPEDPMPALDAVVRDHRATGWKTLSCFVRDCVRGNCFPIDSRVRKLLDRYGLPAEERLLVSLSLRHKRNPRPVARMFYAAGGE